MVLLVYLLTCLSIIYLPFLKSQLCVLISFLYCYHLQLRCNKHVCHCRTIGLMTIFSQYLSNINIPTYSKAKRSRSVKDGYPLFKLFPVSKPCNISSMLVSMATRDTILKNLQVVAQYYWMQLDITISTRY